MERLRIVCVLALLPLGSIAGVANAQAAADYLRHLDGLRAEWRALKTAADSAERARQRGGAVSIQRGSLRVIADSVIAGPADAAARLAADAIDATFGSAAVALETHPVVLRRLISIRGSDTTFAISVSAAGREEVASASSADEVQARLAGSLRGAVALQPLHQSLGDSLRRWFRVPLPAGRESRTETAVVYFELVTASTPVSRRCLAGDIHGCRQLLGLSPLVDPIVEGFTAAQRRTLVEARTLALRTAANAATFDRCVKGRDDAACIDRLRELPSELIEWPIASANMTRSFARVVLRDGSDGASARLQSAGSLTLAAAFASAGRRDPDSLVASWRSHVLASRPSRATVLPSTALATLMWITAFGALALRSSRWR